MKHQNLHMYSGSDYHCFDHKGNVTQRIFSLVVILAQVEALTLLGYGEAYFQYFMVSSKNKFSQPIDPH